MEDMGLQWNEERLVMTKFGERFVKNATPNSSFWEAWNGRKQELKDSGISLSKLSDGSWQVSHWRKDTGSKEEVKKLSRATALDVKIPSPEGLDYLPFQKAGIHFSKDKNALIADEMGLGKTIQAIGVLNLHPEYENILVICPASLRLNWQRELSKWLIKDYTIGVVNRSEYPENTSVVIINYDVVEKHKEKLDAVEWDMMIIDESHYLKNPKALRTKAILGKGKRNPGILAKHKLFLTGTPILNRPVELFPIINSLDPDRWNSFFSYAKRYCDAKGDGWGWDFSGASNLEELQDRLRSTIMIRRLKSEVLTELPPKRRQVIEIPATAELRKLVNQEKKTWREKEEVIENLRVAVALAKVSESVEDYRNAMRNLQEGISAKFTEMAKLRQQIAMLKVPYVVEHIQNASGKVVVFAHHKAVVAEFKKELGDEAVVLVGDTKMEDRQAAVDAFQNDPKIKYFIGSIQAAGVGITLTASSHVVFAELDWVPGNMSQAEDRCHRIGQQESVLVQHIVMEGSIDANMAQALIDKQEVIDKALDKEVDVVYPDPINEIKIPSFEKVAKEAKKYTKEEKLDLLEKLRVIAGYDEDRAAVRNDIGFNRFDGKLGHSLAGQEYLSDKQAYLAERLVHKYRRQLEELDG